MKIAILSANLGDFDDTVDPVKQDLPPGVSAIAFHRFTDADFPPIIGLTPRLQYRIPKLFGWQMFSGYDIYIWFDGGITFKRTDSVKWYLEKLQDADCLFFKHPWRSTIKEEADHIERKLKENQSYIVPRYKNGLHKEQLAECLSDPGFVDNALYASTVFVYRNTPKVQEAMKMWWYYQSRYFTVDQIALPYVIYKNNLNIKVIKENVFKFTHAGLVSHHKKLA